MSYVKCPDCGKEIKVFGESHLEESAAKYGLNILGHLPLDPDVAQKCDAGHVEDIPAPWLEKAADAVQKMPKRK